MSDVSETAERSPETIGTAPDGRKGGPSVLSRVGTLSCEQREASVLIIAVVLFIYFAATTHAFFSHGSFVNIAQYMAPYVIIGIGMVLVMVCLEIDLSVGFVWTLSPFVMRFFIDSGIPTFLAIVITVLILAIIVGGINGVVTTVFGVPSLITTLATGYIVFGYTLTVSSAQQVNVPDGRAGARALVRFRGVVGDHLGHRPGPYLPRDPDPDPVGPVHRLGRRQPARRQGSPASRSTGSRSATS